MSGQLGAEHHGAWLQQPQIFLKENYFITKQVKSFLFFQSQSQGMFKIKFQMEFTKTAQNSAFFAQRQTFSMTSIQIL